MAQLGARFHGMEEVIGSNPIRSTKFLKDLTPLVAFVAVTRVDVGFKFGRHHDTNLLTPGLIPGDLELWPRARRYFPHGHRVEVDACPRIGLHP